MFLVYSPGDGDEQRFPYDPRKIRSLDMEAIERVTGRVWSQFTVEVVQGSALCRRALLWVMLRHNHHGLKFAEVDIAFGEVKLEYSWEEYERMIEQTIEQAEEGPDTDRQVSALRVEQATSTREDGDQAGGKAQLPVVA